MPSCTFGGRSYDPSAADSGFNSSTADFSDAFTATSADLDGSADSVDPNLDDAATSADFDGSAASVDSNFDNTAVSADPNGVADGARRHSRSDTTARIRPIAVRCWGMASFKAGTRSSSASSGAFLMEKVRVKEIWLRRAEGPTQDLGERLVTSFEAADAVLRNWAQTAPKWEGYHKVDFRVIWEDGEIYEGRYDLVRQDMTQANLAQHMHEFCSFHGGLWCPSHMKKEVYEQFIERQEQNPDAPKPMEFARFVEKYIP
jgi:hypothetical protein